MIDCISVTNMRQSDAYTIQNGVTAEELMYKAALGVYLSHEWNGKVGIVTGSGNNGGDGFALACILAERGIECAVYTLSDHISGTSAFYAERARSKGIPITPFLLGCTHGCTAIVDCMLGTGFKGELRENYRTAVNEINQSGTYVISVDINSGLNGDTGEGECVVSSDLTVTIGYLKNGLIAQNASKYINKLVCVDIGIILLNKENFVCNEAEWLSICKEYGCNPQNTHFNREGQFYYRCPEWLDLSRIVTY